MLPASLDLPEVRAQLALLDGRWGQAEQLLLAQSKVDDAVNIYTEAFRYVAWGGEQICALDV